MLIPTLKSAITYFDELKKIIRGEVIRYSREQPIGPILLDSRIQGATEDALFFAIPGSNHDGHAYIMDAYKQGVRQFVVSKGDHNSYKHLEGVNIIKVSHTITALQQLVIHHRKKFEVRC